MKVVKDLCTILFNNLRDQPRSTLFIVVVIFLAFVVYGAIAIASDGSDVFALYVGLVVAAFVVLILVYNW